MEQTGEIKCYIQGCQTELVSGSSAREEGRWQEGEVVERKLAAIFAADVAEYSRLMGLDELGTFAGGFRHIGQSSID